VDSTSSQWLAVTPIELVAEHLRVSNETIKAFDKKKPIVQPGNVTDS
jgi:hypothetical protein